MIRKYHVFITSCKLGEGPWRTQEQKLKYLYELSDKKYVLTDNPQDADLILVCDAQFDNWGEQILKNQWLNRYPQKSFSLSDLDQPLILSHGLYASGFRSLLAKGRVRTGSYILYNDEYVNPFINVHREGVGFPIRKEYLLSFIGRNSSLVRIELFKLTFNRPDIFIEDSSYFNLWHAKDGQERINRQKYYYDILLLSKFSLCPRGDGANSLRLFESIKMGVAPVIVSDDWILPKGPQWNEFSIFIKEKQIKEIEKIVCSFESSYEEMGRLARKAHDTYFSESVSFDYVIENCIDIWQYQMIPETLYWRLNPFILKSLKLYNDFKKRLS